MCPARCCRRLLSVGRQRAGFSMGAHCDFGASGRGGGAFSPRAARPCARSLRAPAHRPRQGATNAPRFAQNNWQMPRIHTIKSNTREKIGGNRAQSADGAYICRAINNVSCPLRTHNYLNPRCSGCVRLNNYSPHSNTDFRAVARRSRAVPARPRLAIGTPPTEHAKKPTNGV